MEKVTRAHLAGYMPIPTADQLAEALENVGSFHDMSAELIAPELLANLLAAPTVKAEQVGMADAYVGAREDLAIWKRRALEAEEKVRNQEQIIDHLTLEAQGETRFGEPSLPAAGSAAESLDAVAWLCEASKEGVKTQRRIVETWGETKDFTDHYHGRGCKVVTTALVSKRKHVAIVAALSARQSAPELVIELVEKATKHLQLHAEESSHPGQYTLIAELRALLATHGRGEA